MSKKGLGFLGAQVAFLVVGFSVMALGSAEPTWRSDEVGKAVSAVQDAKAELGMASVQTPQTGDAQAQDAAAEAQGMLAPSSESEEGGIFSSDSGVEGPLFWDDTWEFASFSMIHTGSPVMYRAANPNGFVVCVNAGHGTEGGAAVQTLCHPDGSPKVTGGSTAAGSTYATAISYGTTMNNGTSEAAANLSLALLLKERLLAAGYDVLMIREGPDVQLDNIARTVFANQYADCHLAIHYDSSTNDKGFFFIGVPNVASYRSMEPVASHWQEHEALGSAVLSGVQAAGIKICNGGRMEIDLTQTSYSTIPSIDIECGDQASDISPAAQDIIAAGIVSGLNSFFGVEAA